MSRYVQAAFKDINKIFLECKIKSFEVNKTYTADRQYLHTLKQENIKAALYFDEYGLVARQMLVAHYNKEAL